MSGITPHALGVHRVLGALKPALGPLLDWASRRRLERAVNISDLRDAAKLRAHKMVFDYLDAGADDEITIRRNKDAYSQHELHYRVLAGLAPPLDLSTRILDRRVEVPFFPAPTAGSKMFHADGEVGVARAAAAHGAMYCLSTMATSSPAEVAAAVPDQPKLFQLYVWKDRGLVRDMLAQAREHGFHALALTVDLTWYGNRERDVRNGFTVPPAYTLLQMFEAARRPAWSFDFLANPEYAYAALDVAAATRARRAAAAPPGAPPEPDFPADRRAQVSFIRDAFDPSFNWDDAEWLCQEWGDRGPVALKGVVRPSDAVKAVDRGFDAVWVSNHGGRQLETAPATVDVLSSVRAALGGAEEWAAAKAAEEEARDAWAAKEANAGAAAVATAGTTASTIDRPVSRADSHVSSCAAKAAAAAVAAAAPSAAVSAKTGLPVEVIADGGVQRGTDILKLLALGADGVAVGKPYLYGLCAGGEAGVHKAMDVLRVELERAMGLLGVGTVGELRERMARGEALVRRRDASVRDFPDGGARGRGYGGGIF